jgi:hypothetical protein
MAIQKLDIINTALRMVGSYHLDRLDDGSSTYEIADGAYAAAFQEIFGENIFTFNRKRVTLTGTESADEQYSHSYTLPNDLNIFIKAENSDRFIISDYYTEGSTLLANYSTLTLYYSYIPSDEDITSLPAYLYRLLSLHMAANMAIELSGSENRVIQLSQQYVAARSRARVMSARQGPAQEYIDASTSRFLRAHNQYGKV